MWEAEALNLRVKLQIKNGRESNQTEVKVSLEMKMHVPLYYYHPCELWTSLKQSNMTKLVLLVKSISLIQHSLLSLSLINSLK